MLILHEQITRDALSVMATTWFGDMVKGVADTGRGLLALDAELHADLETLLLNDGGEQQNLWGINLYPEADDEDFIEYDSLINIRPWQGNRSRGVDDAAVRAEIEAVVKKWVTL